MEVPRHLVWSGGEDCGRVDTANPYAVTVAYESILDAARDPADLAAYLNARLLTALWPCIVASLETGGNLQCRSMRSIPPGPR